MVVMAGCCKLWVVGCLGDGRMLWFVGRFWRQEVVMHRDVEVQLVASRLLDMKYIYSIIQVEKEKVMRR